MGYTDEVTEEVLEVLIDEVEEKVENDNSEEFDLDLKFDEINEALNWDLVRKEPDRKVHEFSLKNDSALYKGKVLKELENGFYIFLIESPEKKMKKLNIDSIETFE